MLWLTAKEKQLMLDYVCPMGRVPTFDGTDIKFSETTARRFVNDLTVIHRRHRNRLMREPHLYDPKYFGIGIGEALTQLVQVNYHLYTKMWRYVTFLDEFANQVVKSTEQPLILFGHKSFGEELFTHIHQRNEDKDHKTLSVFLNLTGYNDAKLYVYPAQPDGSPIYEQGYVKHRMMALLRDVNPDCVFPMPGGFVTSVLFDASRRPHRFEYTDDLFMVALYDGAEHEHVNEDLSFCTYRAKDPFPANSVLAQSAVLGTSR